MNLIKWNNSVDDSFGAFPSLIDDFFNRDFFGRNWSRGVSIPAVNIKDNKLKGYFEFTVDDPQANEIIKTILKQSPKINKINEMKTKITKSQLAEIIREELAEAGYGMKEKEQQLKEASVLTDPNFIAGIATLLGVTGTYAATVVNAMKGKSKEEKKKIADEMAEGVSKATGGDQ